MAGITGIIKFNGTPITESDQAAFGKMLEKLKLSEAQQCNQFIGKSLICGVSLPLAKKTCDRLVINDSLGITCLLEGYIFIDAEVKRDVCKEFDLDREVSDYELLAYLYKKYDDKLGLYLTGCFNLLVYDRVASRAILLNDRFGFYPLYYYANSSCFIFASKIECIPASGYLNQIEFDQVSMAEHLFFNYVLSENTFLKQIKTLDNATLVILDKDGIRQSKYWEISECFNQSALSTRDSFDLMDNSLKQAVDKICAQTESRLNFSLTGGWDSRLILAYLLPEYRNRLSCYSFGVEDSADIKIPGLIAQKENLLYQPIILDEEYYRNCFLKKAKQTIELSNGTRSYKRTHYLYAAEQIGQTSDNILTGIFGDEIFKVGKPKGDAVISSNTVQMIADSFDHGKTTIHYKNSMISVLQGFSDPQLIDEFQERITGLKERFSSLTTQSEKYLAFRAEINLRKYFGAEANSYNDFVYCYSPFINYTFFNDYTRTIYSGHRYDYDNSSLKQKKQSSDIYTKLVMKRYLALAFYPSSRGYTMAETQNVIGKILVVLKKYLLHSQMKADSFGTHKGSKIFEHFMTPAKQSNIDLVSKISMDDYQSNKPDFTSLMYWMSYMDNSDISSNDSKKD